MPLYVLFVWALFMNSFYVLFYYALCIRSLYALFLYTLSLCSLYSLFLCTLFMCSFYALFLCTLFVWPFYVLFSCAILTCSFHKRLTILRMHRKYYCTKTNMVDKEMYNVLKKLGLSDRRARFFEEKISADIVCYLSIEDFLKLGLTDRNAIMSLRIECSTFVLCTPQRVVGSDKFVILKILIENLIDDGFSVKEMCNILCVSERTVLRRMVEYDLKMRNFSNISDHQLDSDVLALTNDYPFCDETILTELLKERGIIIQRYRFRHSMHRVSEVGIQSRRKGRFKRSVYNIKGTNHLWHIDTYHKLVTWY